MVRRFDYNPSTASSLKHGPFTGETMGLYINYVGQRQAPARGKIRFILDSVPGSRLISRPTHWMPNLVCVVSNGAFEAAGYCDSEQEFRAFTDVRDRRPKSWLIVPNAYNYTDIGRERQERYEAARQQEAEANAELARRRRQAEEEDANRQRVEESMDSGFTFDSSNSDIGIDFGSSDSSSSDSGGSDFGGGGGFSGGGGGSDW